MKWADYLISAVRYNTQTPHIDYVRIHEDQGDKFGPAQEMKRIDVVNLLEKFKFITIYKGENGWKKGDVIELIVINGKKYIKTKGDNKEGDNLGELPIF